MFGLSEKRKSRLVLDLHAMSHHHHAVSDFGNDAHVMGNEHQRHADLGLELPDEVEDLGLYRDVKCGRRLVGDQQTRMAGESHRDHHALAHTSRQLMRKLGQATRGICDPDPLEQPGCFRRRS